MAKKIFIAATGQHKGKTTCTLGVVAALQSKGLNVGYCKPVGQKHLTVDDKLADKDAVLFGNMLGFDIEPEVHSPVVVASGLTAQYLENPENYDLKGLIRHAAIELEKRHDVIVYEGTGHPGVGSVADVSNAQVAQLLDVPVVIVVEGGIGRTIDELNLSLALFRASNVEIRGVIVNKVHADKIERVRHFNTLALNRMNIPLLGVIPYDRSLSYPLMASIRRAVQGRIVFNAHMLDNQVEEILAGSLIEVDEFTYFHNMLLVVTHTRYAEAIQKIKASAVERSMDYAPLSGVIVTGDGRQGHWYTDEDLYDEYLQSHEIPVITTRHDTYDTVVTISRIEVKINTHTPWKIQRAIEMIQEHVNLDALF